MSTDTQGFPFSQYAARLAEYKQTIQRKAGAGLWAEVEELDRLGTFGVAA